MRSAISVSSILYPIKNKEKGEKTVDSFQKMISMYGVKPENIKTYYVPIMPDAHGHATGGVVSVCVAKAVFDPKENESAKPVCVRGVSYCTPQDQFVKKEGRTIALGRAVQALETKIHQGQIMEKAWRNIAWKGEFQGWEFYSQYNVDLNWMEEKMFEYVPVAKTEELTVTQKWIRKFEKAIKTQTAHVGLMEARGQDTRLEKASLDGMVSQLLSLREDEKKEAEDASRKMP